MQWDAAGLGWDARRLTFIALALALSACPAPKVVEAPRVAPTGTCQDGDLDACEASCAKKADAQACFLLGAAFEEGEGRKQDYARAATLYDRACDLGFGTACGQLAVLVLDGHVDGDLDRFVALCTKGCDAKSGASCLLLGGYHDGPPGGDGDPATAAPFYQRGCDLDEAAACAQLGAMYLQGRGVKRDDARGRALLEKACKGGDVEACGWLEDLGLAPKPNDGGTGN